MGKQAQLPLLLTRQQAAERLSISVIAVDRLRQAKELETVRMGRRAVRISSESVTAFLRRKGVRT
jgi:excisionase family DNA binding protein